MSLLCWTGCCLINVHQTYGRWGGKKDSWLKKCLLDKQNKGIFYLIHLKKSSCVGILGLLSPDLLHTRSATCCPGIPQNFRNRDYISKLSQKGRPAWLRTLVAQWPLLSRKYYSSGKLLCWILLNNYIIISCFEEYHPRAWWSHVSQEVLSMGRISQRRFAHWLSYHRSRM